MSMVNISGKHMACDIVVAEHTQAELSKLEAQTSKYRHLLHFWLYKSSNNAE